MDLILFTIQHDWPVLLPIVVASIILAGVAINRWKYLKANERDMEAFIGPLQRDLDHQNLDSAYTRSEALGGVVGRVAQEGIQTLHQQRDNFSRSFDITIALAVRKLEKGLDALGTIGTVAPYLGLFGTVVRILLTFGDLSRAGSASGAPEVMFGIGSALIATAFGLAVAILAVVANNHFRGIVARYENDFQLLKLVFLTYSQDHPADGGDAANQASNTRRMDQRPAPAMPSTGTLSAQRGF